MFGYKIKNLTIEGKEYTGLFGATAGAFIENVTLENIKIEGIRFVGALAGEAYASLILNSSAFGGTVEGQSIVGGLVGQADSSEIATSYVELDKWIDEELIPAINKKMENHIFEAIETESNFSDKIKEQEKADEIDILPF